jgi:hypothetical protein
MELAKKAETGYLSDVLIVFSLCAETRSNFSPKCLAICPWKRGCPKITRCGLYERLVDQVPTGIQRNSIECTPRSVGRPLIKESLDFRRMIREATSQKRQYLGRKECYGESVHHVV